MPPGSTTSVNSRRMAGFGFEQAQRARAASDAAMDVIAFLAQDFGGERLHLLVVLDQQDGFGAARARRRPRRLRVVASRPAGRAARRCAGSRA